MTSEMIWVYITAPNKDVASNIGRQLLEKRLAGCVNIFDGMTSMYWWQGAIQEDAETVLIAKAPRASFARLVAEVTRLHPYEVPCILALPVTAASEPYLAWLRAEAQPQGA